MELYPRGCYTEDILLAVVTISGSPDMQAIGTIDLYMTPNLPILSACIPYSPPCQMQALPRIFIKNSPFKLFLSRN